MKTLSRFVLALLLLAPGALCVAAEPQAVRDTLVFVVRHAEKATGAESGDDPPLTPAGEQRALALAAALADAGISAIYSTDFRRTRATAEPLAERLDLAIGNYDAADPAKFAQELLAQPRGLSMLVVGHSNTVPALVHALSGEEIPAIADTDYTRLYVIALPAEGRARLMRLVVPGG